MAQDSLPKLRSASFPAELLQDNTHYRRLRVGLWLYLVLRALADVETGRLVTTPEDLAALTGMKVETVASLLGRLRKEGYIAFVRQDHRLYVKLEHWAVTQARLNPDDNKVEESTSGTRAFAVQIAAAFNDEASLARFEECIEDYPRAVVERAFRDAASMPNERIRKNRTALFNYLLRKYAQEEDDAV